MTLREAIQELAAGCKTVYDVARKIQAAGCSMEDTGRMRSQSCPVAQYLSRRTGSAIITDGEVARHEYPDEWQSLPPVVIRFIDSRDYDIRKFASRFPQLSGGVK